MAANDTRLIYHRVRISPVPVRGGASFGTIPIFLATMFLPGFREEKKNADLLSCETMTELTEANRCNLAHKR